MGIKRIEDADDRGEIHLCEPWRHEQYNDWKLNIKETDQDDREVIKDLSWQDTHRKWDEDYYCWTTDLDSFFTVLNHFTEAGYSVTFDEDVLRAYGRNMASKEDEDDI